MVHELLADFRPDAIVHLGEMPSAPYSMMDVRHAVFTQRNNVESTLNLLFAMRDVAPDAHLVKLGTMGEYGTPNLDIPEGFFEVEYRGRKDRLPFPRQANSWYHLSKVHDSANVTFACRVWGLRSTDIMQGVVYGTRVEAMDTTDPRCRTRLDFDQCFGTALNRYCAQAVIGEPLTVYGSGGQKRGFLPLRDSIQCLTLALENPPARGEYRVFNQFEDVYDVATLAGKVQEVGRDARPRPASRPPREPAHRGRAAPLRPRPRAPAGARLPADARHGDRARRRAGRPDPATRSASPSGAPCWRPTSAGAASAGRWARSTRAPRAESRQHARARSGRRRAPRLDGQPRGAARHGTRRAPARRSLLPGRRRPISHAASAADALHAARAAAPVTTPAAERAYSVQLHVHGSFSEGVGSIDSHSHEATDVGADVIWWSDHDFRITSYGHVSTFGFEDMTEPMPGDGRVLARRKKRNALMKALVPIESGAVAPGTATSSATIRARVRRACVSRRRRRRTDTGEQFAGYRFAVTADRSLLKRPLAAEVTLLLSVFPEQVSADARPVVEIVMSEHPPREGLPFEAYRLRYVLDDSVAAPYRDGTTFVVPVPFKPGEWNDLALPVSRDAVRGFPFIHGEDNSLGTIVVGVEVRRGARATVRFDDLRIEQELSGDPAFDRQKKLIDAVGRDYPDVHQLQGVEASWVGHHLNEFSVDTRLVDYAALDRERPEDESPRDWRERVTRRVVEEIHGRGGLVSFNHMFGTMMEGKEQRASREQVLDELLAERVYGADILEVGYRDRGGHPLADHLWVWDQLALNGLFLVGTGVSDSHGGPSQRWRTDQNNFVSWIYARSPSKDDLIAGLRAGRVFFGDIVLFDGTLDLTTPRGARMGQIVLRAPDVASEQVEVKIDGLASGDSVRLIVSGEEAARWTAAGASFVQRHEVALHAERPTVVRVEAYAADGTAKVLSNPITFVRSEPPAGIPAARAGS